MRRGIAVPAFFMMSFVIVYSADLFAQEAGNSEKFWNGESSTCMLFRVQNLTASAYGGGIGLGFITSPTHMWRLSLSGSFEYNEREASRYPGMTFNSRRLSLSVASISKLKSWDDLYMFIGPGLGLIAEYNRDDSFVSTNYGASLGCTIGIGYTFHEQLSLTAEYGASISVSMSSETKSFRAGTGGGGMTLMVKL